MNLYLEDKPNNHKGPLQLSVTSKMSIVDLKSKVFVDFQIPINAQRWVLNNHLAIDDSQQLSDFGVQEKSSIFVYIITNEPNGIGEQKKILNIAEPEASLTTIPKPNNNELGAQALPLPNDTDAYGTLKVGWACPLCTLINSPNRPGCVACSENRPINYSIPSEYKDREHTFDMPDELKKFLADDIEIESAAMRRPQEKSNDLNKISLSRKSTELFNIIVNADPPRNAAVTTESNHEKTAIEPKTKSRFQTSIVMTAITASPNITKNKYRGVDNYNPHVIKYGEAIVLPLSAAAAGAIPKPSRSKPKTAEPKTVCDKKMPDEAAAVANIEPIKTKSKHYSELLDLDSSDIISNAEPFDCPICLTVCERNFGITLRNCLHVFCKECIVNTVKYCEEAEVMCPYMDSDYSCDSILSEREIKALVSKDAYEQHLAVSLRLAENRIENAFHCKTPNCRGWCIYEDNVNLFKCPICQIANCLTCRVMNSI